MIFVARLAMFTRLYVGCQADPEHHKPFAPLERAAFLAIPTVLLIAACIGATLGVDAWLDGSVAIVAKLLLAFASTGLLVALTAVLMYAMLVTMRRVAAEQRRTFSRNRS